MRYDHVHELLPDLIRILFILNNLLLGGISILMRFSSVRTALSGEHNEYILSRTHKVISNFIETERANL